MIQTVAKYICCFCFLFITGHAMEGKRKYSQEERKIMYDSIDEINKILINELSQKFNLHCIGSASSMPQDIQELELNFILHKQTTIEEAREMEICATERFVELINQNEKIRPFLRDYPWNHNRVDITIAFRDGSSKDYAEGVRLVLQAKERIYYFGPKRFPNDIHDHIKEEPYSEAKKIVKESPSVFKKEVSQKPSI